MPDNERRDQMTGRVKRFGVAQLARGAKALLATALLLLATTAQAREPSVEDRINLLMRQGQFADAYDLAESGWPSNTPNRQARLDFIGALSLKAQNRHQEAIAVLRRLNAENPSFTRVRAELAHSLFVVGDHDAARFHFTDLSQSVADNQMRDAFESYLATMRHQRPYRLGGYASLAPSTNISNRTTTKTVIINGLPFELAPDSRAQSGVGLSGGLSGERSFFFKKDVTLTVAGRFDGTKFQQKEFDRFQLAGSAYVRKRLGSDTLGAGFITEHQNEGHATYRNGIGGGLEYGRLFEGGKHLFASVRLMNYKYPDASFLDGWQMSANLAGRQKLAPGSHLTAGMRFTADRTKRDYYDNDGVGIFASHIREWQGGLTTEVAPTVGFRQYHAKDPVFGVKRQDVEVGGTVRLLHRKLSFEGFAPRLEYSYLRQFSNHPLQKRDAHSVNIVMTREF